MKKGLINFVLFLIFFSSCEKEIEIPFPKYECKPVVSCLFREGNVFVLRLTESQSFDDSTEKLLDNAKCYILSQDNTVLDSLKYNNGFYLSTIKPEKNKEYKLKIQDADFPEISALSSIPESPKILKIDQEDFAAQPSEQISSGDIVLPMSRFSLTIKDPVEERNFYEIKLFLRRFWNDSSGNNPLEIVSLYSYSKIIKNEDILDYTPKIIIFSDSLFNGETKTIDFLYLPWWRGSSIGQESVSYFYGRYRLYYQFRAISKAMYNYQKVLIKHVYNQQTSDFSILGDPVSMVSNIKNAYGIFAGYSEICDTIFVKDTSFVY